MKITKKHYDVFKEMTASELRVVSRMAEIMAINAEALETPNEENYKTLMVMDSCMRASFHAMHKGYSMIMSPVLGRGKGSLVLDALNNVGRTIELIEANN